MRKNYVEYGRRLEKMIAEIKRELLADQRKQVVAGKPGRRSLARTQTKQDQIFTKKHAAMNGARLSQPQQVTGPRRRSSFPGP